MTPPTKRQKVVELSDDNQTHLTAIADLSKPENADSINISDLIGSPYLVAQWQFNFMIDVDFVLSKVHKDVVPIVQSNFVIGDFNGQQIGQFESAIKGRSNITVGGARLSNPFATHHTKMMVLFFTENGVRTAQVVIHTANLIPHDWNNMTQGVWKSERVGLKQDKDKSSVFELDLCVYLQQYRLGTTEKLVNYLKRFDWSKETARVVGSVPGTHEKRDFGLMRVSDLLEEHKEEFKGDYEGCESDTIVLQGSSIGSLGVTDKWLTPQLVGSLDGQCVLNGVTSQLPSSQIIWPTVENVRSSFDGYDMGVSLHFKNELDTHKKQYLYMKERMNVWKASEKHRSRAMPHIKTYSRFTKAGKLRWVLLTSANVSKYAWGSVTAKNKFSIPSWELGVLLFPQVVGKSVFELGETVLPYDWPLQKYTPEDEPWTKGKNHLEKDVKGERWVVK